MSERTVAYVLVTYQHENFVTDAVRSALAQEGPPLDILISDDASPDGTWVAIENAVAGYSGPHRLRLNRNPQNMGMNHYNRILELVDHDIIVIAHGDDVALPNRASRLVETLQREKVSLVTSDAYVTDAARERSGLMVGNLRSGCFQMERLLADGWQRNMLGATMAWRREVLTVFGGVDRLNLPAGYDLPMVFRATLLDGAYYLAEPLLEWRRHDRNLSEQLLDRGSDQLVEIEGAAAHAVTVLMAMLEDLAKLQSADSRQADFAQVRAKLLRSMMKHLRNWIRRRNRLFVRGMRATWLDKETWLERRPPGSRRIRARKSNPS
ncbi:MAG: glycosyltransferase [Rhodospirillaceae bacterium]|nr:glycosyltransferase [Rhodospirillaceae bacterium]